MKSFGCPRSRRGKLRCSRAINCNLPNAPSANLSESSGPVAIMWVHHMTNMAMYHKFVTLLKCHVANLSARAPPCPCIRRSLTCELYLRWQQASTHAVSWAGTSPCCHCPRCHGLFAPGWLFLHLLTALGLVWLLDIGLWGFIFLFWEGERGLAADGCCAELHVAAPCCCPHASDSSWAPVGTSTGQIHQERRDVSPLSVPEVSEVVWLYLKHGPSGHWFFF